MTQKYEVWFRCPCKTVHSILANHDFKNSFNTTPYREYTPDDKRKYTNLFSGNWAWRQAISCCDLVFFFFSSSTRSRTLSPKMKRPTARCSPPLFSVATRPRSPLLPVKWSTTSFIFLSATFTTVPDALTQTAFPSLLFSLSPKVHVLLTFMVTFN